MPPVVRWATHVCYGTYASTHEHAHTHTDTQHSSGVVAEGLQDPYSCAFGSPEESWHNLGSLKFRR